MMITSQIQHNVASIDESSSVLDAINHMNERYIGSIVITGAYGVKGIFTERDLMIHVIGKGLDPAQINVGSVTDESLVKVKPDADVEHCLTLMKENHCRHLIVFDGDNFVGVVSIRDMVALLLDEKEAMISRLKEYINNY